MLVYAFIAVLILLLPLLLVALKLDMTLTSLAAIYVPASAVIIAAFLAVMIFRCIKASKNGTFPAKRTPDEKKSLAVTVGAAVILWCFSYVVLSPSGVCDNTRETAAVSLMSETLYEYSSFSGEKMAAGQPIFNKIQLMPVFYAAWSRVSAIPLWVLTDLLIPLFIFAGNMYLMYRISGRLFKESARLRTAFMLSYCLLLVAGTYVPDLGIPVTFGYSVLRMGYSGWAVFYGLVVPALLLCILKKNYLTALITLVPLPGLVRLDRIFFALRDPVNSVKSINAAGKLFFLYILAVIMLIVIYGIDKKKIPPVIFFVPSVTVAYTVARLASLLGKKKEYAVLLAGSAVVILSATGFYPYRDAGKGLIDTVRDQRSVKAVADLLPAGSKLLAEQDIMDLMRLYCPEVKTAFSKAENDPYLAGLDFEKETDHYSEYRNF